MTGRVIVVVFEPRRFGEPPLTLTEQLNQVFGPFSSEDEAQAWIDGFSAQGGGSFHYLITRLDDPPQV